MQATRQAAARCFSRPSALSARVEDCAADRWLPAFEGQTADEPDHIIVSVEHVAENNLPKALHAPSQALLGDAARCGAPIVPRRPVAEVSKLPSSFFRAAESKLNANVVHVIGPTSPFRRPKPGAAATLQDIPGDITFIVQHQDMPGDGTVARTSGEAPRKARIKRLFRTTGYDHQGSYNNDDMRMLTRYLICRIVQDAA